MKRLSFVAASLIICQSIQADESWRDDFGIILSDDRTEAETTRLHRLPLEALQLAIAKLETEQMHPAHVYAYSGFLVEKFSQFRSRVDTETWLRGIAIMRKWMPPPTDPAHRSMARELAEVEDLYRHSPAYDPYRHLRKALMWTAAAGAGGAAFWFLVRKHRAMANSERGR